MASTPTLAFSMVFLRLISSSLGASSGSPSVQVNIGGKLPRGGSVSATCSAIGTKGIMQVKWFIMKSNKQYVELPAANDKMHAITKSVSSINDTYVKETVTLTVEYDLMEILSFFVCKYVSGVNKNGLRCQGSYKCVADFTPPKAGVVIENVANIDVDGTIGLPPRPIISKIIADSTSASVFWNQQAGGEVPILGYQIKYKLRTQWRYIFNEGPRVGENARSAVIPNLKPYTEYNLIVVTLLPEQLKNVAESVESSMYRSQTDVDGPTVAPKNIKASMIGSSFISLAWEQPPHGSWNGPLDGFLVAYKRIKHGKREVSGEKEAKASVTGTVTAMNATGLLPWSTYLITVSGYNKKKDSSLVYGKAGNITVSTHIAKPSTAPPNLDQVAVNAYSAKVKWDPPALADANGPIDGYLLKYQRTEIGYHRVKEAALTKEINKDDNAEYNLTGLLPWSSYDVKVIAYNLFHGKRLESDASHALVVQTHVSQPKDSPINLKKVKTEARSVVLTWQAPALTDASGPIDGYIVKYERTKLGKETIASPIPQEKVVAEGENNNFKLQNLLPWSTYKIRVIAYNYFTGRKRLESSPTEALTVETLYSQPRISSRELHNVTVKARSVLLRWQRPEPKDTNGPIDGYVVYYRRTKSGSIVLNDIANQMRTIGGGIQQYVLDGLKPWSTYLIELSSYNEQGDKKLHSLKREKLQITTEVDAPSKSPTELSTGGVGSNYINVLWKALSRADQNGPLDGYEVYYQKVSTGTKKVTSEPRKEGVPGSARGYKLMNLSPWSKYNIWVLAYNLKDNSKLKSSPEKSFMVETKQGRPSGSPGKIEVSVSSPTSLFISWNEPKYEDLNGELTGYVIRANDTGLPNSTNKRARRATSAGSKLIEVPKNQTSYELKKLRAATRYSVEVAASTAVGHGKFSKPIYKKTNEDAPSAPRNLRSSSLKNGQITALWDLPADPNGKIQKYVVVVFTTGPNTTKAIDVDGSKRATNISGIETSRRYLFRVQAITIRKGEWSSWVVLYEPQHDAGDGTRKKDDSGQPAYLIPVLVGLILLLCLIVAILIYRKIKANRGYDREKMEGRERLTNLDVEMGSVEKKKVRRSPDRQRILDSEEELSERGWSDEDENMNNNENAKKAPTTTTPPSTIPCDPAHPPICKEKFAEHVQDLKADRKRKLKEEYKEFKVGQVYTWDMAMKPKNKFKNRYANIVAYDHSRVMLKPIPGDVNGSDYINACYVDAYNNPEAFIATQGPTESTTLDFWRMIWQERSTVIVALTKLEEAGKSKCYMYWPESDFVKFGDITVMLLSFDQTADYVIRTLEIRHDQSQEVRQLFHFHFVSWPDHGTPEHPTALLSLQRRVRHYYDGKTPMVVHCSAGVGRTGCFILIDSMLEKANKDGTIDIYNYLQYLRTRRINMVQTEDQYGFIHDAILEAITCGNTEMLIKDVSIMLKKFQNKGKDGMTHYEREFRKLCDTCPEIKWEDCATALQPENLKKSRSLDIIPRDADRVALKPEIGDLDSTYINAVHVDGYRQRDAFILTEAPMTHTIPLLWKMIHEKKCGTIVVLYCLKESQETFPRFWPAEEGESSKELYGNYVVEMISEQMDGDIYSKRLKVASSEEPEETQEVQLLQYVAWPHHEVPESKRDVLALINRVEDSQRRLGKSPILVICSDGGSRCGTFSAVYNSIERVKIEQLVDVFQCVRSVRIVRPAAVAGVTQYAFVYEMVLEYLNSFDNYANFS